MPVLPSPKSQLTLLKQSKSVLGTRTGLNDFSSDSKARALLDVFNSELIEQRQEKIRAFEARDLGKAKGADLDSIGDELGVLRFKEGFAYVDATERNLAFYVNTGTFGGINSGSDIVLPKGTIVYSDPNENEFGAKVEYALTSSVTLPSGSAIIYVSARARSAGSFSNVGKAVLRRHAFTGYADATNDTLKVVNFFPVLNGTDQEKDTAYRFRLAKYYQSLVQANRASMQLSGLEVPGVVNLKVIPGYFGIGTTGIVVLGLENQSTTSLVSAVQNRLDVVAIPGLKATAVAAVETGLEIEVEVKPSTPQSTDQRASLEAQMRRAINEYLQRVGIGGSVSLREISALIQRRTSGVVQLKTPFKRVYITRGYSNSLASEREALIQDSYTLEEDAYMTLSSLSVSYL